MFKKTILFPNFLSGFPLSNETVKETEGFLTVFLTGI